MKKISIEILQSAIIYLFAYTLVFIPLLFFIKTLLAGGIDNVDSPLDLFIGQAYFYIIIMIFQVYRILIKPNDDENINQPKA